MTINGVIFDCDGVLVDSEVLFLNTVKAYLGTYGIQKEISELQRLVGQTDLKIAGDIKGRYLSNQPITAAQINSDLERSYVKFYSIPELPPMAGLPEFVSWCRSKGLRLAVASSSKRDYVAGILEQFGIRAAIQAVLTGDDVTQGKPDPEIYRKAAKALGIPESGLIVIEDSRNGIKAAKAAGIYTIGFKGSVIEQDTGAADYEARSYADIARQIERLRDQR